MRVSECYEIWECRARCRSRPLRGSSGPPRTSKRVARRPSQGQAIVTIHNFSQNFPRRKILHLTSSFSSNWHFMIPWPGCFAAGKNRPKWKDIQNSNLFSHFAAPGVLKSIKLLSSIFNKIKFCTLYQFLYIMAAKCFYTNSAPLCILLGGM